MKDDVNHPSHYTTHPSGIECIQITEHMGFCLGNAVKYIWRAGLKHDDAVQDLKKAAWYVAREITRRERLAAAPPAPPAHVEKEGGPDLFDAATNQVLAHPAQKLAVQAFSREAPVYKPELSGAEQKPERWIVEYSWPVSGWRRSTNLHREYASKVDAQRAITNNPLRWDEPLSKWRARLESE